MARKKKFANFVKKTGKKIVKFSETSANHVVDFTKSTVVPLAKDLFENHKDFWRTCPGIGPFLGAFVDMLTNDPTDISILRLTEEGMGLFIPHFQDRGMRYKTKITDDNIKDVLYRWKQGTTPDALKLNKGLPPPEFSRSYKDCVVGLNVKTGRLQFYYEGHDDYNTMKARETATYVMTNEGVATQYATTINDEHPYYYGYPHEWDVSEVTDMSYLFKDENLRELFSIPENEYEEQLTKYSPTVLFVAYGYITSSAYGVLCDAEDFVAHWSLADQMKSDIEDRWAVNREVSDQGSGTLTNENDNTNVVYFGTTSSVGTWRGTYRQMIIPFDQLGKWGGFIMGLIVDAVVGFALANIKHMTAAMKLFVNLDPLNLYFNSYSPDLSFVVRKKPFGEMYALGEGPGDGFQSFTKMWLRTPHGGDFNQGDSNRVIAKQQRRRHLKVFDINNWDVSNVTKMEGIFQSATVNIPLNNWNLNKVILADRMFMGATFATQIMPKGTAVKTFNGRTEAYGGESSLYDKDGERHVLSGSDDGFSSTYNITNWQFSEDGTSLNDVFKDCKTHISGENYSNTPPDILTWSVVPTSFTRGFYNCSDFNQDISDWNMAYCTSIAEAFYNCVNFNQDISSWNIRNVTNFTAAFTQCTSFKKHNIFTWPLRGKTNYKSLSLTSINITSDNVKVQN